MLGQAVRHTIELDRILSLPRRRMEDVPLDLAARLTELLKTPDGTQSLRFIQALALSELYTQGGLFGPIAVGNGKSLITLLAPYILDAERPLLVLPAGLLRKTEVERKRYEQDWRIPKNIRLHSYELLGRVQGANFLWEYKPDLLIFDEVHKVKRKSAAVTRRVLRYMREFPETKVVALSGTIMRKSLLDFGHILKWCLKGNAPIPETQNELDEWAMALDEKVDALNRYEPGALLKLATGAGAGAGADAGDGTVEDARRGFRSRLVETPGVVATIGDGERVDCSLYINAIKYNVEPQTERHFAKLRGEMCTPDGWELSEAVDVWRHSKELALGLFYRWEPRPPEDWRRARREWHSFVREVLSRSRTLDSELQVVQACDAGKLDNQYLERWRAIKDTFTPNTVAVWCDDSALNECIQWMKTPGLVWTEHDLFARRLAQVSGVKYYGAKGLTNKGEFIDNADPNESAIASIDANREGRNLQNKWSRMLVTSPMEGADVWQQTLGRLHRPGQQADEVVVDVLLGCKEHCNAWRRALASAEAVRDTTGAESKLLLADVNWPSDDEIAGYAGARWA